MGMGSEMPTPVIQFILSTSDPAVRLPSCQIAVTELARNSVTALTGLVELEFVTAWSATACCLQRRIKR